MIYFRASDGKPKGTRLGSRKSQKYSQGQRIERPCTRQKENHIDLRENGITSALKSKPLIAAALLTRKNGEIEAFSQNGYG